MTAVNGQLIVESEQKHLKALAEHLRRREGVVVRIFDANGNIVLDSASGEPCTTDVTDCRRLLEENNSPSTENGMEFMAKLLQVLRQLRERLVSTAGVQKTN